MSRLNAGFVAALAVVALLALTAPALGGDKPSAALARLGTPIGEGEKKTLLNLVAHSPDGKVLVWGSLRQPLKVVDARTYAPIRELEGSTGALSLAFTPDSARLVIGRSGSTVRVFDVATGERLQSIATTEKGSWAVAVSPDGQHVAAGGSADGSVQVFELASGKLLKTLLPTWRHYKTLTLAPRKRGVLALTYSPDGARLLAGTREWLAALWDLAAAKKETLKFHTWSVGTVAFAPDGRTFATGDGLGEVEVHAVDDRKFELEAKNLGKLCAIQFTPDSRRVVVGGEKGVYVLKLGKRLKKKQLRGTKRLSQVRSLSVAPDGKSVATGHADSTVLVWKLPR